MSAMSKPAVKFVQVSKRYQAAHAVKELNLHIPAGQIVTMIGPSGCGKTTSLKMINRLIEPSSGEVWVEGSEISRIDPVELRRNIGYVIQQIGLFPHLTIEENIGLVPKLQGIKKSDMVSRTEELLELIGLDPSVYRRRYPQQLSGGQQQRIGVARALAADPSIILMDEPFSSLDPISRVQLQNELLKLNKTLQKTIVFVTHDISEAIKIADRIVLMKEGRLEQAGTPSELLYKPNSEFVAQFIGMEPPSQAQGLRTARDVMSDPANGGKAVVHSLHALRGAGEIADDGVQLHEHTPLSEVLSSLQRHAKLPVVDQSGRVVGVVTSDSVILAMHKKLEKEAVAT